MQVPMPVACNERLPSLADLFPDNLRSPYFQVTSVAAAFRFLGMKTG
jgi:hypothetical protein